MALNAKAIHSFFVNLRKMVVEKGLGPADIYNCDVSSFVAGVVEGGYKVLCRKGTKRAYRRGSVTYGNIEGYNMHAYSHMDSISYTIPA
jgi:hypothetical protein